MEKLKRASCGDGWPECVQCSSGWCCDDVVFMRKGELKETVGEIDEKFSSAKVTFDQDKRFGLLSEIFWGWATLNRDKCTHFKHGSFWSKLPRQHGSIYSDGTHGTVHRPPGHRFVSSTRFYLRRTSKNIHSFIGMVHINGDYSGSDSNSNIDNHRNSSWWCSLFLLTVSRVVLTRYRSFSLLHPSITPSHLTYLQVRGILYRKRLWSSFHLTLTSTVKVEYGTIRCAQWVCSPDMDQRLSWLVRGMSSPALTLTYILHYSLMLQKVFPWPMWGDMYMTMKYIITHVMMVTA